VDAAAYLKGDSLEKMETEKVETKTDTPGTAGAAPAPVETNQAASLAETTQAASPSDAKIGIEEFQKVRLVTAKIVAAERVPKSNRLMRLQVDLGSEQRQVVAGIAAKYTAEELVGRNVVVVANLKPAKLMGVESNGMVLAASVGEAGEPSLLAVEEDVPPGTRVK
jgi:methionyl-tRNA synthetase